MRGDTGANQPVKELGRTISGIGSKTFWLEAEATFGTNEHGLCRRNFVRATCRCGLDIDNDRVRDVDEIIEPVTELHPLVGLGRPGRAGIARRDQLRWFVVGVRIVVIERNSAAARVCRSDTDQSISPGTLP